MERINPPMIPAFTLRNGELRIVDSLSELGIYSCLFVDSADKKQVLSGIPRNSRSHSPGAGNGKKQNPVVC